MKKRGNKNLVFAILILYISAQTFACCLCCSAFSVGLASMTKASEYEIKAVYLCNFLLFTKWPQDNSLSEKKDDLETICIGIVGEDPFGSSFADVEGKMIKSNKIKFNIKRYGAYRDGLSINRCRLLFISSSERKNIRKIINQLKGSSILTVSETEGFLKSGGMINLTRSDSKIRWEINLDSIKKAGIKLNSQVLRNASRVIEKQKQSKKADKSSSETAKK